MDEFRLRAYGKVELALLYSPRSQDATALQNLYRWMMRCRPMMDELNADGVTLPKLTFTAYACQYYSTNGVEFDLDLAWHTASGEPADPVTP